MVMSVRYDISCGVSQFWIICIHLAWSFSKAGALGFKA